MALSTASNWFWNFLLAFFTPFIVGDIDFLYGYVFAGCNLVAIFLIYFFVIEGQGRTLEEIALIFDKEVYDNTPVEKIANGAENDAESDKQTSVRVEAQEKS